ncbi:MAG: hypothetical protein ACP5HZ_10365 [Ferrimicrobium sp.]|uniref:hypothetical protein n=1 Tax=Ferrimicrobium sp. TaxID=2926050 RepID=UPI00260693B9|nr:hypothetical protein [Ferrimicrobium sp.]
MKPYQVLWLDIGIDVLVLITFVVSLAARIPWLDEHTGWKRYLRPRGALDTDRCMSRKQFVLMSVVCVLVGAELIWAVAHV